MLHDTRYGPLGRHLAGLDADTHTLSFQEIEKIIGRALPPSASGAHGRQWWANTSTHSQGQAWLEAGWRVDDVHLGARRIRFRRDSAAPGVGEAAAGYHHAGLSISKDALSARALRMIADYAEAIDGDEAAAIVQIVEDAAMERRRQTIQRIADGAPRVPGDSSTLIREERDAR